VARQHELVAARVEDRIPDTLLVVEHEPVVTLGSSAREAHLLLAPEEYERRGITVVRTDRGGDVTYHGPGQLVFYPICKLAPGDRDPHRHLRRLEEAGMRTLERFGIRAFRSEGKTGIWTDRGKIAAIGVHLRRWVTFHGLALNVAVDLAAFSTIVPCGLADRRVTSMAEILGPEAAPDLEEAAAAAIPLFRQALDRDLRVMTGSEVAPKPPWLRVSLRRTERHGEVDRILRCHGLHTVCEEADCPNIHECYGAGTATFLIMGDVCTRHCGFCAVKKGVPLPLDPEEPRRVAAAVKDLRLRHAVITSVDRDDLPDGGAAHIARTVTAIRAGAPSCRIELLTPDFAGDEQALETVFASRPDIFGFNLETVGRLHRRVRPDTSYAVSLDVLRYAARRKETFGHLVKSGFMLGLGETDADIRSTLEDLAQIPCDLVTIGQYLAPTRRHLPVKRYVPPEEFAAWKREGERLGIGRVYAGPLVRSSYHAEDQADPR
jgi:lipoic acid synthetase